MDIQKKLTKQKQKFKEFIYGVNSTRDLNFIEKLSHTLVEKKAITYKEKSLFYQLFSVLVNAGVTTLKSLGILKERVANERFYRIICTLKYDVERGESLSKSMEKFPDVFNRAEIGIVQTGEAVGALDSALKRLSAQAERQNKVRQDLKSALVYPAMIAVVLAIAGVVMVTFVIPELRNLYTENGLEITGLSSFFINAGDFLAKFWLPLLALAGILYIIFKIYTGSVNGKMRFDAFLLDLPYFGEIVRKYNITEFTSTLGVLVESGIPIQTALRITNRSLENSLYKLKILELIGRVQTGDKISTVLSEAPWLFPGNVTQMIEIGEQSANLGNLSLKVSEQYNEELRYKLKNMNTVIGPIVIIIVAVFVVLFALAILLPIFNLTQNVAA